MKIVWCVCVFSVLLGALDVADCLRDRVRRDDVLKCNKCKSMEDCFAGLKPMDCAAETDTVEAMKLEGGEKALWDAVLVKDGDADKGTTHCVTVQWNKTNEFRACVKEKVGEEQTFCEFANTTLTGTVTLCGQCAATTQLCNKEATLKVKTTTVATTVVINTTISEVEETTTGEAVENFPVFFWIVSAVLLHLIL